MSNQEILEKALLKAHKKGWNPLSTIPWKDVQISQWQGDGMVGIALLYGHKKSEVQWMRELEGIIYNHDFAKALWSEEIVTGLDKDEPLPLELDDMLRLQLPAWQFYLRQMVIADDPIKYLGENI